MELPPNVEADVLSQIDHIVVLMLENRSFDHLLGYLALDETYPFQLDGLEVGMSNSYDGQEYRVFPLPDTTMAKWETPEHGGAHVDVQLSKQGGGFVKDYIKSRDEAFQDLAADPATCAVMGYHTGDQLFAFDHLARHFTVCDRWFSSVRGATMPNRLYSVCGTSGGQRANKKLFGRDFPLYHYPAFTRHLDHAQVSWKWYRPNVLIPPTLKLFDPKYLGSTQRFASHHEFLQDARDGNLASVSWIDPGFFDKLGMHESDDHPPTDVSVGQHLVAAVCNAVMQSPRWDKTMLVIVYDEHGGFFDHVMPGDAPDDHPDTATFGVRVPAIVVSPHAAAGVSSEIFDHTSLIRTILDRFCPDVPTGAMGQRVAKANSLAAVLQSTGAPASLVPIPEAHQAVHELFFTTHLINDVAVESEPDLAELIAQSTGGLDLVQRVEGAYASAARPPLLAERALGIERFLEPNTYVSGRPLDDLQLGLIAAAGEIAVVERDSPSAATKD